MTPHQGERITAGRSALWNLLDQALGSPVYPTRWSIIDHLTGLDGDALDEDVYDRRRLRYLEAWRRDENRLVRDEATLRQTSLAQDASRRMQKRAPAAFNGGGERLPALHIVETGWKGGDDDA